MCVLTVLLLCAVPADAAARNPLKGVWRIDTYNGVNYKILDKDGNYYSLTSEDGGETFQVICKGDYRILMPGVYVENMKYEKGSMRDVSFSIAYTRKGDELHLVYDVMGDTYREVWKKVRKRDMPVKQ